MGTIFRTIKHTDETLVAAARELCRELEQPDAVALALNVSGHANVSVPWKSQDNERLQAILELRSSVFTQLNIGFAGAYSGASLVYHANPEQADHVNLEFGNLSNKPDVIARFIAKARVAFGAIPAAGARPATGDIEETVRYLAAQEELSARVQGVALRVTEEAASYQARLQRDFDERRKELESDYRQRLAGVEATEARNAESLDAQSKALAARSMELDDRQATHARRALREFLKKELKSFDTTFTLTEGTATKRVAIHAICVAAMVFFGIVVLTAHPSDKDLSAATAVVVLSPVLSRVAAAFALAATIVFYVRWTNDWFQQHASAEFDLKRLALDIDRASWVAELAMEWAREKNGEQLPPGLLETLSRGLFETRAKAPAVRHPSEDLASFLREAARVKLKFGDSEIEMPGKAVRRVDADAAD